MENLKILNKLPETYSTFLTGDILSESDVVKLQEGSEIFMADLPSNFCFLLSGKLLLVYEDINGFKLPLRMVESNTTIIGGYSYFLEEKSRHNLYYLVLEEGELLKLSSEKSAALLQNINFFSYYIKDLTGTSFSLIEELIYRLGKNVETFLAYLIYKYSEDGILKVKNLKLFSQFVKASRSTFYASLGSLIEQGAVERNKDGIVIKNLETLKFLAEI